MSGERIAIFTEQERTAETSKDQSLGPHLQNATILGLLQEILNLNRALKTEALAAIENKNSPLVPGEPSINPRSFDKMAEIERVTNGSAVYEVYATKDLIILSRTEIFSLLGSLWKSLTQHRITSNKRTDRLVVRRRQASLISWNGSKEDHIQEPVLEDALIAILEEYRSALAKTLNKAVKNAQER